MKCAACGDQTGQGRVGDGEFEGQYFCNSCWSSWDESFAPAPDFGATFPPGQEVVLVDALPEHSEFSGMRGTVLERSWDLDPSRLHISVRGTGHTLALKPECLKPFLWQSRNGASVAASFAKISCQVASEWLTRPISSLQQCAIDELRNAPRASILDLGYGLGRDAMEFAKELGADVVALEICKGFDEVVEAPSHGNISLYCPFDIYQLCDYAKVELLGWSRRFQMVWSNLTLSFLLKDEVCELLLAMHRLVTLGGMFYAIVCCADSDPSDIDIALGCNLARYSEIEFADMLQQAGWSVNFIRTVDACVRPGKWLHVAAVSTVDVDMQPCVKRVIEYHEKTSLGPGGRAKNGSMDSTKEPDKFLRFQGTNMFDLDPEGGSRLARVLRYAFGLAAWKGIASRGVRWSLRTNASSGALQPLEFYVVADRTQVSEYDGPLALLHYHSYWHSLEFLYELPEALRDHCYKILPAGSILVAITAFYWRNIWKYGEPGFRYVQQDVGHAIAGLGYAAASEGMCCKQLETISDSALSSLLGLKDDRPQAQQPQALLALCPMESGEMDSSTFTIPKHLLETVSWVNEASNEGPLPPVCCDGHRASWKHKAPSRSSSLFRKDNCKGLPLPWKSDALQSLMLKRRSCHELDAAVWVDLQNFLATLKVAMPSVVPFDMLPFSRPLAPLVVFFVHRVRGLAPGVYAFVRDTSRLHWIKSSCFTRQYIWQRVPQAGDVPLFLLLSEDVGRFAQQAAAGQESARNGVASCAVFVEHQAMLCDFGAWMYKRAHWEAGMVVNAMYIAAESIGMRGTAMGAFMGPWLQDALGISTAALQDVEHWTFGQAIEDKRLETTAGYEHLKSLRAQCTTPSARDGIETKRF